MTLFFLCLVIGALLFVTTPGAHMRAGDGRFWINYSIVLTIAIMGFLWFAINDAAAWLASL